MNVYTGVLDNKIPVNPYVLLLLVIYVVVTAIYFASMLRTKKNSDFAVVHPASI